MTNFSGEMKDNASYEVFFISDSAVTIDFGNVIDEQINMNVITLFNYLLQHPLEGMIEVIPAYSSLSVYFDFSLLRKKIPQQIIKTFASFSTVFSLSCRTLRYSSADDKG